MMIEKGRVLGFLLAGMGLMGVGRGVAQTGRDTIPLGGNAWGKSDSGTGGRIDTTGVVGWSDGREWFDTWLRVTAKGKLHIWVGAAVPGGKSELKVALGKVENRLDVEGSNLTYYDAGMFTVSDTGYQRFRIEGISRTGAYFAEIPAIVVQGEPLSGQTAFVPNNEGNFFHWGRRGPSVHLNYALSKDVAAEWFYNEVTVPEGQDVQGSYFMACGFGQGYFGMQVNSPTERHILFSVWSPFETDDPGAIPDSQRIRLLRKGDGVHAGVFGSEGSGGQSYLNYLWKAGHSYRFLLHAKPADRGYTEFTAWFYAPEEGRWRLIASFSRPQTHSWLSNLHSFLENFEPEQGTHERYVLFNHQWIRDTAGHWLPLNRARFTVDNTGRKGYRMDYAGGVRDSAGGVGGSAFYLRNDGFFNDYTPAGVWLERKADANALLPAIDLIKLP
jgi:Domain of unknown function (DUF3472)/Domain of unknown function (DUF5077)